MDYLSVLKGSLEAGVIYAIMALGVYITYRILNFPDLTVDGSFTTGAGIAALLMTNGVSPILAVLASFVGGAIAGSLTGILHTKGKINPLLSGILMMIALYTINLRIMGSPNISLRGVETLFTGFDRKAWWLLLVMTGVVMIIKVLIDWFLHTEIGMALRATGNNARMIRSFGVHTDRTIIMGVSLSNGMVALSGGFIGMYNGFADLTMGVGMIVIGLASVIIGETLFGAKTVIRATIAVILGAILYRIIVAVALQLGLDATDMKLVTALIVIIALIVPLFRKSYANKKAWKKRNLVLLALEGVPDKTVDMGVNDHAAN